MRSPQLGPSPLASLSISIERLPPPVLPPPVVPPPPPGFFPPPPVRASVAEAVSELDGPVGERLLDESPAQLAPLTASARTGASIINLFILALPSHHGLVASRRLNQTGAGNITATAMPQPPECQCAPDFSPTRAFAFPGCTRMVCTTFQIWGARSQKP